MNCALHKNFKLQYFCQTCLDPICSKCIQSNPHSNQYHKVATIQQAVHNRRERFQLYINGSINPLRESIAEKLQQLKEIQSKQQECRDAILRDIQVQFQEIQNRTKQITQKKTAQYQTQIKYYQAYLNTLDDLAYTFESTCQDPYNFLILYHDFTTQLKNLQLKQIQEKISRFDITVQQVQQSPQQSKAEQLRQLVSTSLSIDQFPRQIKSTYQQVSTLAQLRARNQFLNGLIAQGCEDFRSQQRRIRQVGITKYKQILTLYNQMSCSVRRLDACKTCVFCQVSMTLEAVNDLCQQNKSTKVQISAKYAHLNVQIEFKGTKRHHWVDSSIENRRVPDVNAHPLLRANLKKEFANNLKDLGVVKCCLRKYQIQNCKLNTQTNTVKEVSFMQPFEAADKGKKGIISKINFKYILTKTFQMNDVQSHILVQLFSHKWKQHQKKELMNEGQSALKQQKIHEKIEILDGVNYTLLKGFVENPLSLYEDFEKIQQQIQKTKPIGPATKQAKIPYKRYAY